MSENKHTHVCPVHFAGSLDNFLRRMIHKPGKILSPFIIPGIKVLDLGCGPGYFTVELARLVGEEGRVVAADIQPGMLEMMTKRIRESGFEKRVEQHLCPGDRIGISQKFDFILAFWMVHEVPDQGRLFGELKEMLAPAGRILIVEPKFHVTCRAFRDTVSHIEAAGLIVADMPKIPISRAILVSDSA